LVSRRGVEPLLPR